MALEHLVTADFDEKVLQSGKVALVDFWATWCQPCQMLGPVIEELAGELDGVVVGKVNVDEEPDLAAKYGVMSIPTVIIFKDGKEAQRFVGVRPKDEYIASVK